MMKNVKKYLQIICLSVAAILAVGTMSSYGNAATETVKKLQLAAVDLPKVLTYIMKSGDVFQGSVVINHNNKRTLKLRIFNQRTGRVRYVLVDERSGRIL